MITFAVLFIMMLLLIVVAVLCLSIGGTVFTIIFGDLIVCIWLIIWLLTRLRK